MDRWRVPSSTLTPGSLQWVMATSHEWVNTSKYMNWGEGRSLQGGAFSMAVSLTQRVALGTLFSLFG